MAGMPTSRRYAPQSLGGVVFRVAAWLMAGALYLLVAGCGSMTLPTPDQAALAVLPTNTPTSPTPRPAQALGPRPTETATPTATTTATATATATPTTTPSPAATPTSTATPGPLARTLGFNDSLLSRLDAAGYTIAERQSTGRAHDRVQALILAPPQGDAVAGLLLPRLLVYHLRSGSRPALLFEDEGSDETILFAGYGASWTSPLGWRDITGDGLLELPIWAANGGFCFACTRVYILQLAPVDDLGETRWQVRELTGAVPFLNLVENPIIPKWLSDFNRDGRAEIEALDGSFEFAFGLWREHSPRIYRPLIWDGQGYSDVSPNSPSYFDGQIQRATEAAQATFGQPLASQDAIGRALTVLLAYDASGRRDEGWAAFWQLSDPANWPGEETPGLLDLLSRIREHLLGQYGRGEPFAPWPPVAPTVPAPSDAEGVGASNQITQTQPLPQPPPSEP